MGGGGLMQLVAYGSQDIYLTGKPQITFFKSVYRRYTNFAIESIAQDVLGTPQFGGQVAVTISRNGDLLKRLWIEYSPQDLLELDHKPLGPILDMLFWIPLHSKLVDNKLIVIMENG